jgi:hypothetical protein
MSKRIADLLDQPERLVSKMIMKLEGKNGYPSHDVRHLALNIQQARRKLADLDLDPDDTTAEELYHALQAKYQKDSLAFDVENNFHSLSFESKVGKAKEIIEKNTVLPQRWVLKSTAAKNLLRRQPPKKLMKQLSYRSIESMLKRENIGRLFIEANSAESDAWRKQLQNGISKLDSTAFEMREISITWLNYSPGSSPLVYNDDIGALALAHTDLTENSRLLGLAVLIEDFLGSLASETVSIRSNILQWWKDTNGLIADLDGHPVSMNLKDASLNHAGQHEFTTRFLSAGRAGFWESLVDRYENPLEIEEDMLAGLSDVITPRAPLRQPAFEYAEDF